MADLNITTQEYSSLNEDSGQSLVKNGDFELAPATITAPTNVGSRWIDGTASGSNVTNGIGLGWGTVSVASSSQAGWDSTVSNSGTYSMKLSTLDVNGSIVCGTYILNPQTYLLIPLYASTSYTLVGYIKTNNVATNAAWIDFRQYNSALSTLVTTSSTKLSGTNNFTKVSFTVTTNASAAYATVFLRNNVAGNIGDAWFDDITLTYNPPGGNVTIPVSVVVAPGIQTISGPKIWS